MEAVLRRIDSINRMLGKIMSFFILPLIVILCYEVVRRYIFDSPTIWVNEIAGHIFGMYAVLGGGYVLLTQEHIKSDVLYARFSRRTQALIDLITSPIFFLLVGIIFFEGIEMAQKSIMYRETTVSFLRSPIYPIKTCIPIAAFLMLLQGVAQFIRNLAIVFKGRA